MVPVVLHELQRGRVVDADHTVSPRGDDRLVHGPPHGVRDLRVFDHNLLGIACGCKSWVNHGFKGALVGWLIDQLIMNGAISFNEMSLGDSGNQYKGYIWNKRRGMYVLHYH